MIELQVANNDITNGTIAVSWCVDQNVLNDLGSKNVQDPQMIIVVAPSEGYNSSREYRKVVPLRDLMTYVEFHTAGLNKIWAFISHFGPKGAKNKYLERNGSGDYKASILSWSGDQYASWLLDAEPRDQTTGETVLTLLATPIQVRVPELVFAKEPAAWEKDWVNHWFRSKPIDQCHFRQRRLLAYTVQPIVMFFDLLLRVVLMLAPCLWLSRGLSFKYLLHPLTYSLPDTADTWKGGSWAIASLPEDQTPDPNITPSYLARKLWRLPLTPIALIFLFLITHFHAWFMISCIFGVVLLLISMVLFLDVSVVKDWFKAAEAWWVQRLEARSPWYLDSDEIDFITCTRTDKYTSVSNLPPRHRTFRLRFQDLKSRVCRPFSR